jgi:hypothetical protein
MMKLILANKAFKETTMVSTGSSELDNAHSHSRLNEATSELHTWSLSQSNLLKAENAGRPAFYSRLTQRSVGKG